MRQLSILLICCSISTTISIPIRGNHPWSIVLCKFADIDWEPRPPVWFQQWFSDERPLGSISEYWNDVSNGLYTVNGSRVHGWFTLDQTRHDVHVLASLTANITNNAHNVRDEPVTKTHDLRIFVTIKHLCIEKARRLGFDLHPNTITVINDQSVAIHCREHGVLLTPQYLLTSALAHEMAHGFSIGHSYSDQPIKVFPHGSPGEYDDKYDLMSTANAFVYNTQFGMTGPGMNGPHLEFLGWLPVDRIVYWTQQRHQRPRTTRLASLTRPHREHRHPLLIMLPFDRDNPQNVFTIEYRTPDGQDRGLPRAGIIIHKVSYKNGHYFSYVIKHSKRDYDLVNGTEWMKFLVQKADGQYMYIHITVIALYKEYGVADIVIDSTFDPTACISGEFRHLGMCMQSKQDQTLADVLSAAQQDQRNNHQKECHEKYKPLVSVQLNGLRLCLTKQEQHRYLELQWATARRAMFFRQSRRTFGMNKCKHKSLWRLLDEYDFVCVSDRRRSQIWRETDVAIAQSPCPVGSYVRRAHPNDRTCVSRGQKIRSNRDNRDNEKNLKSYAFFNGRDEVYHDNGSENDGLLLE